MIRRPNSRHRVEVPKAPGSEEAVEYVLLVPSRMLATEIERDGQRERQILAFQLDREAVTYPSEEELAALIGEALPSLAEGEDLAGLQARLESCAAAFASRAAGELTELPEEAARDWAELTDAVALADDAIADRMQDRARLMQIHVDCVLRRLVLERGGQGLERAGGRLTETALAAIPPDEFWAVFAEAQALLRPDAVTEKN